MQFNFSLPTLSFLSFTMLTLQVLSANAETLSIPIAPARDALANAQTITDNASQQGMWSPVSSWPVVAIHLSLLPNGNVLSYGSPIGVGRQEGLKIDQWNPQQGLVDDSHITTTTANQHNSFCSTSTLLSNGKMLISGGNSPRASTLYDYVTNSSEPETSPLADDRWYSTLTALPDGRAVITGGVYPHWQTGTSDVTLTPEIYTPGIGWRTLLGANSPEAFAYEDGRYFYPHQWVAPDGKLFGISGNRYWKLDPNAQSGAGSLTVLGTFKSPVDDPAHPELGKLPNVGPTATAVMYDTGKIIQVGGNGVTNGYNTPSSREATLFDINGASPVVQEARPMTHPRQWANATVLPDGKVVVTGGTRKADNGGADAILGAEIWDPASGNWSNAASAAIIRNYHSSAILLPNGALLSAGGGVPGPVTNLNAEIYFPPYLFTTDNGLTRWATRPQLSSISTRRFDYAQSVRVEMADATRISKISLIALGAATHSFNSGQRFYNVMNFTQSNNMLSLTTPENANVAPPGYYMLFVVNDRGVPSQAVIIALGTNTPDVIDVAPAINIDTNLARTATLATSWVSPWEKLSAAADGYEPQNSADNSHGAYGNWRGATYYNTRDWVSFSWNQPQQISAMDIYWWDDNRGIDQPSAAQIEYWTGTQWQKLTDVGTALDRWNTVNLNVKTTSIRVSMQSQYATGILEAKVWGYTPPTPPLDSDGDGVTDAFDAFPFDANEWKDSNGNGKGDQLEADFQRTDTTIIREGTGTNERIWNVNPDNDSVTVTRADGQKIAEITVGKSPWSLALSTVARQVWVSNKQDATLTVISTDTLTPIASYQLPANSQPHGIVFAPNIAGFNNANKGNLFVALEATGEVLRLDSTNGAILRRNVISPGIRHVSMGINPDLLYATRFITPPLQGESTATINLQSGGGEVYRLNAYNLGIYNQYLLKASGQTPTEISGPGVPNYLGAPIESLDGTRLFVPSKQDDIGNGQLRTQTGSALTFEHTVRAATSVIDLGRGTELTAQRIDHDNSGMASAMTMTRDGKFLITALPSSREVAIINAQNLVQILRFSVGRAPMGVVMSSDRHTLFVHNYMDRSVGIYDLADVFAQRSQQPIVVAVSNSIATERLTPQVLKGKQFFYDAADTRLARDGYLSCAVCHDNGGHDGRIWDLSQFGEGLRNTISLRGKGFGHGRMHWTANFDEVQDFEGQIRQLAGGTGLMSDANFANTSATLGNPKAGLSANLDALAAYVASLQQFTSPPARGNNLSTNANTGMQRFIALGCGNCHAGTMFTDSSSNQRHDVGTLKSTSGLRLYAPIDGLDTPTLHELWATAPYLHDGSAGTIDAAIRAHTTLNISAQDSQLLAAYLTELRQGDANPSAATSTSVSSFTINSRTLKTITSANNSATAGSRVVQNDLTGNPSQQWTFVSQGNGFYKIRNVTTNLVLTPEAHSTAPGTFIVQGIDEGTLDQHWQLVAQGNGFKIVNRANGYLLTPDAHLMGVTPLIQWVADGNTDQIWWVGGISRRLSSVNYPAYGMTAVSGLARISLLDSGGDNQWTLRTSTQNVACVLLESTTKPGQFLNVTNGRLGLSQNDNSVDFSQRATFCPRNGLAGSGVSLESYQQPGRYLRHRNYEIWLDLKDNSTLFSYDASFKWLE